MGSFATHPLQQPSIAHPTPSLVPWELLPQEAGDLLWSPGAASSSSPPLTHHLLAISLWRADHRSLNPKLPAIWRVQKLQHSGRGHKILWWSHPCPRVTPAKHSSSSCLGNRANSSDLGRTVSLAGIHMTTAHSCLVLQEPWSHTHPAPSSPAADFPVVEIINTTLLPTSNSGPMRWSKPTDSYASPFFCFKPSARLYSIFSSMAQTTCSFY